MTTQQNRGTMDERLDHTDGNAETSGGAARYDGADTQASKAPEDKATSAETGEARSPEPLEAQTQTVEDVAKGSDEAATEAVGQSAAPKPGIAPDATGAAPKAHAAAGGAFPEADADVSQPNAAMDKAASEPEAAAGASTSSADAATDAPASNADAADSSVDAPATPDASATTEDTERASEQADAPHDPGAPADQPSPTDEADAADGDGTPDAVEAGAAKAREFATSILNTARTAGAAGSRSLNEGISAVRELSKVRRAHAQAKEALASLESDLEEAQASLDHRRDVEANYQDILTVQGDELKSATAELVEHRTHAAELSRELVAKTDELREAKRENDRRLAPYKGLMETAKENLSDAEHAHAEAKRALRSAQAQADGATNGRDTRLSAANRAVDNAAARLQRLQDQLAEMKRDPSTGAKEISEMSGGVAAALAQLENAREDVTRLTAEMGQAVQNAQTHLYTQKKSLEEAERDLKDAQDAERGKREEYESLRSQADEVERGLSERIKELNADVKESVEAQHEAQTRIDAAQELLDEAKDIHAHPEVTRRLARTANELESRVDVAREQVEDLAGEMRSTRERTQRARALLYAVVVAVVALVALVAWLVLGR